MGFDFDLGLRCDYFLSTAGSSVRRNMFVGIVGSKISVIEPFQNQNGRCRKFIHAHRRAVLPSLINGHTHLAMSLFKGLADDLPFEEWLHQYILPIERELVTADFVRVGTQLAAIELIRFGATAVCDSYFFETVVGEVLEEAGLRGIVSEGVSDFPTPDTKTNKNESFKIADEMRERFSKSDLIVSSLAPHAPYSVSDDTFKKCANYAQKYGLPLNIHVSETQAEVQESLKQYAKTPPQRLKDLGVFENSCILAHCVHISESDAEIFRESKASVIHNPESNMKLGSGIAPIPMMLKHGLKVGLGTDGSASNNNLNLFQEMDTAAKLQKLAHHDNTVMTAKTALEMGTWRGAEALGWGGQLGELEVGKLADLIVVDLDQAQMIPMHDLASQLVYSASGSEVETVICHGKILMEGRSLKTVDEEKVFAQAHQWQERIQRQLSQK